MMDYDVGLLYVCVLLGGFGCCGGSWLVEEE